MMRWIITLALLAFLAPWQAAAKANPKWVSVILKSGDTVEGKLVSLQASGLTVNSGGKDVRLGRADIKKIFDSESYTELTLPKAKPATPKEADEDEAEEAAKPAAPAAAAAPAEAPKAAEPPKPAEVPKPAEMAKTAAVATVTSFAWSGYIRHWFTVADRADGTFNNSTVSTQAGQTIKSARVKLSAKPSDWSQGVVQADFNANFTLMDYFLTVWHPDFKPLQLTVGQFSYPFGDNRGISPGAVVGPDNSPMNTVVIPGSSRDRGVKLGLITEMARFEAAAMEGAGASSNTSTPGGINTAAGNSYGRRLGQDACAKLELSPLIPKVLWLGGSVYHGTRGMSSDYSTWTGAHMRLRLFGAGLDAEMINRDVWGMGYTATGTYQVITPLQAVCFFDNVVDYNTRYHDAGTNVMLPSTKIKDANYTRIGGGANYKFGGGWTVSAFVFGETAKMQAATTAGTAELNRNNDNNAVSMRLVQTTAILQTQLDF